MRLTLRTLLAYLDNILEPSDSQELGEKIKENANASELTHRIRDCMTQPRLSSPAVHGRGIAADANSVSEYLDNTLPVERMPEFERTCLESDVHLSEVAACHQILTMVLGEPAEVDERIRKGAYDLGRQGRNDAGDSVTIPPTGGSDKRYRVDSGAPPIASAALNRETYTGPPPVQSQIGSTGDLYEESSGRGFLWPVVLMLLAGFLITTAVLNGLNWLKGSDQQVASNDGNAASTPPIVPNLQGATEPHVFQPPVTQQPADQQPADQQLAPPQPTILADPPSAPPAQPATPLTTPPTNVDALNAAPTDIGPPPAQPEIPTLDATPPVVTPPPLIMQESDTTAATAPSSPSVVTQPAPTTDPPVTAELPEVIPPPTTVAPPTTPPVEQLADNQPQTTAPFIDEVPAANPIVTGAPARDAVADASTEEAADDAEPAEEEEAQDVARSVVEDQALALWDTEKQSWMRLPLRAPLRVGQRFRNLPAFRPQLLLVGGLQMTVDGTADFSFGEPNGVDTPRVNISHGRGLFVGMGQAPSRVELEVAGRVVTVQQGDPNSEFAVEVLRTRVPGSNPATAPRHHIVSIWPISGRIGISEGENDSLAVEAGQMWTSIDQREAKVAVAAKLPNWTSGSRMRDIDRIALQELEPLLSQDRSLTLSLQEAAQHRRTDVRSLAARCLAALGRFEPLIETLGDRKQHANWPQHMEQLRIAVNQHPDSSALVAQALRRATGPDAEKLMELLTGVSPPQLAEGGAERLIADLENESLEVRVAAIETLKHITGMSQLYRADRPAAQRQLAVQKWRGRLAEGEIHYAQPPLILSGKEEK